MATPSKGWIGKITLEGSPVKEETVGSPAVAAQTTFYSMSFPVVNPTTKVVTDDEDDVTVYVDDVAKDSADFTLTGADGKIVFAVAPGAATVITITYDYKLACGYCLDASPEIEGNVEEFWAKNGSRLPAAIAEGNIRTRLRFRRGYVDRDAMGKAIAAQSDGTLPEFTIYLYPLGQTSGYPTLTFNNCKCATWRLDNPQDSWVADDAEFICKSITPGTYTPP